MSEVNIGRIRSVLGGCCFEQDVFVCSPADWRAEVRDDPSKRDWPVAFYSADLVVVAEPLASVLGKAFTGPHISADSPAAP